MMAEMTKLPDPGAVAYVGVRKTTNSRAEQQQAPTGEGEWTPTGEGEWVISSKGELFANGFHHDVHKLQMREALGGSQRGLEDEQEVESDNMHWHENDIIAIEYDPQVMRPAPSPHALDSHSIRRHVQ
jgi:hypothetical protein